MTRLTTVMAKGRSGNQLKRFNNYLEVFPYKILATPVLKNSVSNRKEKNKVVPCLEELGVLLSCWKGADYDQKSCLKEIKSFNECYAESLSLKAKKTMDDKAGKSATKLTSEEVNKLLKRFPQPPMTYK